MSAAGLIFSNIHDGNIAELTRRRTMASVPFGCRYRMIDFPLSNMVNSGISNVGIITHDNYKSLLDHIGTGADWDLARRTEGIKILPPNISAFENGATSTPKGTRLQALFDASSFIAKSREEYMVICDCDVICNLDAQDMIRYHEEHGGDVTMAVKHIRSDEHQLSRIFRVVQADRDGVIHSAEPYQGETGELDVSMNVLVMKRTYLYSILMEAQAKGYEDFYPDIIMRQIRDKKVVAYPYTGYYSLISSLAGYYECNMRLLEAEDYYNLFTVPNRPIYTKLHNSPPTKYMETSHVTNSLIADGCIIEGEVENSIIFRGVHIGKGAKVKNSILLQNTRVENNVSLHCVITDKDVLIQDNRNLSGHETMPFYIDKGMTI